jgi:hypothetical protein
LGPPILRPNGTVSRKICTKKNLQAPSGPARLP